MKNFFISDLHFGHEAILKFDNRPWSSVKEMEEGLIDNWNSVVSPEDHVYDLGDFCWQKTPEYVRILKCLNGNKHICPGNHGVGLSKELSKVIVDYKEYYDFTDSTTGYRVICSHYPMLFYRHDSDPNVFMLCGHLHKTKEWDIMKNYVKQIRQNYVQYPDNRGQIIPVEACKPWMNYTPQTMEYLVKQLDSGVIYDDKKN